MLKVFAVDSSASPLVSRGDGSRQQTSNLSHLRVKESRTLINQILWVHEFKGMPGVFNPLPLHPRPVGGVRPRGSSDGQVWMVL